jgi:hypothetical protein
MRGTIGEQIMIADPRTVLASSFYNESLSVGVRVLMNKFHSFSGARKTRFSVRRVSKTVGNVCQVLLRDFFCVEIKPFAWEKRGGEPSRARAPRSSTVYRLITHSFIPTSAKLRERAPE